MPRKVYGTRAGDTEIRLGGGCTSARWGQPVTAEVRLPQDLDARLAIESLNRVIETVDNADDNFPIFAASVRDVRVPYADQPNLINLTLATGYLNTADQRASEQAHCDEAFQICEALADFTLEHLGFAPPVEP